MTVRGLVCLLAGGVALAAPAAAFGTTLVGQYNQNGDQGVNSTQSGIITVGGPGYSAPGTKVITGSSKGTEVQNSTNVAVSVETIGSPGGTVTVIGDASQQNRQGIDSRQGAKKGKQNSTNIEGSSQIIAPNDGDTIIGTSNQANDQAENSSQLLAGAPKSGGILFTEATGGSTTQNSTNAELSAQVILG